ncbi:hypothetical protein [Streptomyces sp. NPDC018347]|uniref:hypothetical protein n=1 Tax=Streptomyces sp. NPDC018347 TaxID=3157193 RepID=UPI0033D5BC0F
MLEHLAATGSSRQVRVPHLPTAPRPITPCAPTPGAQGGQLAHASADFWYEEDADGEPGSHRGLMDLDARDLPADAQVHLCGSVPFMRAVRARLLRAGVPTRRIRYEVFGPDLWLARAEG